MHALLSEEMSHFDNMRARLVTLVLILVGTSVPSWSVGTPTPVAPSNGAVGQPVLLTVSWNAVAFADSYHVDIATDPGFASSFLHASVPYLAGSLQSTQIGPLSNDTTYYWRVRAIDGAGDAGMWSAVWQFRTVGVRPGIPILVAPANSSTNIPLSSDIRWNADPIATAYRVQVATAQTFTPTALRVDTLVNVQWGESVQSLPLPAVENKTRYYWRVASRTAADSSAWSTIWNFTTIADTPSVPLLQNPPDGSQSIPVGPTPFSWTASSDATIYGMQIATDPGFQTFVVNDSLVTGTSKQVSGLLYGTTYHWRMNAKNVGASSAYSSVRMFSTKLQSPSPLAPASNSGNQPIAMTLRWSAVDGAASYSIQVSTSSGFTSLLVDANRTVDSLVLPPLANKTKHYWRVSARAASGDTSAHPALAWNFTTIADTPAVPTLNTPADGASSIPVNPTTLAWFSSADASTYLLQVAEDPSFLSLVFNDSTLTTTSRQLNGLTNDRRYYWRVQARNLAATTEYSPVRSFTTKPPAPLLVSPTLNATNVPVSPLLVWTSDAGASVYRIQVATASTFATPLMDVQTSSDSLPVGPLANKVKYYWRVSARTAGGDTSAFPGTAWSFTTIVADVTVPVLQSPLPGATSVPVSPAPFTWSAVPDAANYRLQIARDTSFTSLVYDDSSLATTSRQISGLQTGAQYVWRVSAKNASGTGLFSDFRTFSTVLAPPAVVAPVSGSLGQSIRPTLQWTRPPGAVSFRVQVSKTTQFSTLVAQTTVTAESTIVGPLGNDTLYYWRVSARNGSGDSSIYPSTAYSFRTRIATPVLNIPAQGSTDMPLNPVLSWYSTPGAAVYRLQVSDDPAFPGSVLFDDPVITGTSRQVGPLSTGKTYFWRVNARNAAGTSISLWSDIRSFSTFVDTPAVPVPVWPPDRATDIAFLPELQWSASPGAGYYGLQVAQDSLFQLALQEYSPLLTTSFRVGPLISNTRYFWRVRAINASGIASSMFSTPRSFVTILDVPSLPVPLLPASRASAQPVTPVLAWSRASSAEWYRVQISTDSYFPATLFDSTGIRDTSFLLPQAPSGLPRLSNNATYYWRVKALNRLDSSGFTLPFNFTTRIAAPMLLAPLNGATHQPPTSVVFQWQPVAGAQSYGFRLATDSLFKNVLVEHPLLAGTTTRADSLSVSTRYFWQVIAKSDSNGSCSSLAWSFTTIVTVPGIPTPTSPPNGGTNLPTAVRFQWEASIGAESYHLQIAADTSFGSILFDFPSLGVLFQDVQSLAYATTYSWRIRASNGNGPSPYSPVQRFTVTVPAPAVPYLSSPADGAVDISVPVRLTWGQASGATSYRVRIFSSTDSSTVVYDTLTGQTWCDVSSITPGARYYWQITAVNPGGTSPSAVWGFLTRINYPGQSLLAAPANGATNVALAPAFSWTGAVGATSYHVQVARDSTFLSLVVNDSGITESTRIAAPLQGLTRYYWRVRGRNPSGFGPFSQAWSFRTIIGTPVALAPASGALHQGPQVLIQWHSVQSPAIYRLQLARDPGFSVVEIDASVAGDTTYLSPLLPGFTRYYWRVGARSLDASSTGAFTEAWHFTTALDTPAIIGPQTGVLEQPVRMTFRWSRTPAAESYHLEIGSDNTFQTLVFEDSTILDTVCLAGPLAGMTTHWWRVRAQNPADKSAFTRTRTFTTTIGTPELQTPADRDPYAPVTPLLTWSTVPGAARYRVQVARDSLFAQRVVDDSLVAIPQRVVGPFERSATLFWRVRAKSADGMSIGAYAPVRSFTIVPPPPGPTSLASPPNGTIDVPRAPVLRWYRASNATRYGIQIGRDSLFSGAVLDDSTIVDTAYQPAALEGLARHYWRICSINPGGSSAYTSPWSFLTVLASPLPLAPIAGAIDQPVSLRFVWSRVPQASTYRIQLTTDSLFRTVVFDDSTLVDTSRTIAPLVRSTRYFWRVRARSTGSVSVSPWCGIQAFQTVMDPPAPPTPVSPPNHAQAQPTSIALTWNPALRASRYHVQVATDSTLAMMLLNDSTVTDTFVVAQALMPHTRYWWKVRAINTGGSSPFSSLWDFATTIATPLPLAPPDSATGLGSTVTLAWAPSPGASLYSLVVSRDSLFRSVVFQDSAHSTTTADLTGLEPFTTYFWRVKAIDALGQGAYSSSQRFTTSLAAPLAPRQVAPGSGKTSLLPVQTFRWNQARTAQTYEIQIAIDSPFDSTVLVKAGIADTAWTVATLEYNTRYFWRVRGWNSEGPGAFSSVWSFQTAAVPPGAPSPVLPVSSSAGQLPFVHFSWSASAHARFYHLQVSPEVPFTSTVFNDSTLADTVCRVGPLEYSRTYFWRVRALNEDWTSGWSPVWSTVIMNAPVVFDLFQNFPNPFNPTTVIRYDIPAESEVGLELYNILGQTVKTLVRQIQPAGRFDIELDATNLPSGVYLYRLTATSVGKTQGQPPAPPADPFVLTRKLIILK